jgi:hypothetical protein
MKRLSIILTDKYEKAFEEIKKKYEFDTDTKAINFCVLSVWMKEV